MYIVLDTLEVLIVLILSVAARKRARVGKSREKLDGQGKYA